MRTLHRLNKRAIIAGAAVLCCTAIGALVFAERRPASMEWVDKTGASCQIRVRCALKTWVEFGTSDGALVERIVMEPLRHASLDTNPAKYQGLGSVAVQLSNGEEAYLTLFWPLGHFKTGDQYFVADFTDLGSQISKTLIRVANDFNRD